MKVLNISLEKKLFEKKSKSRQRVLDYSGLFERFDLIILSSGRQKTLRFENMLIVPTNSFSRASYIMNAYLIGKKLVKEHAYDTISAQDPFETGLIAWLLAKKYNLKLQVQIHGDYFGSPYWRKENFLNRFRYYLGRFIIKRANTVRVVSNRIKNSLVELKLLPENITVVPIYTPIAEHEVKKENKNNGKFIFLTVGRLVSLKNIDMQIEAMTEVLKVCPKTELWVVGDGPERKNLELKSRKLEIENKVSFFGWKEDSEEFYKQADAFLLTSNYEGWGMAVIEAASFGLPVIMTDVGCAGEVIKDRESGIIIRTGDVKALAEAMIKLVQNKGFYDEISRGAKEAVSLLPDKEPSLNLYKKSFNILEK